jgi:predicted Zn-dependent protease with MMP-like domain
VAVVTVAFALFDVNALSKRRLGRLHGISIVAYLASFALVTAFWVYTPKHGPVEWLFPGAVRIASAVILFGSRAFASTIRVEQHFAHPQSKPERRSPSKATLTPEEIKAAEAYDDQWQIDDRRRNREEEERHETHASASHFERLVQTAIDELPADIQDRMSNVSVTVEDEPPPGQRLLGLYRGIPLTRRGLGYSGALPDTITIYRGPIERLCEGDAEKLRREVRHVVRHEIAHHFGISDQRLVDIDRY